MNWQQAVVNKVKKMAAYADKNGTLGSSWRNWLTVYDGARHNSALDIVKLLQSFL